MNRFSKLARHGILLSALAAAPVFAQSGQSPSNPGSSPSGSGASTAASPSDTSGSPTGGAATPTAGGSQSPAGRGDREPYRDTDSRGGDHNFGWIGLLGLAGLSGLMRRNRTDDRVNDRVSPRT
jgi:hypothetical protein